MASQDVEAVIKKAIQDDSFRLALSRNIEKTLEQHQLELSPEEIIALKNVDWKNKLPTSKDVVAGTWVHIYKTTTV